jgi:hypothetical protein
VLGNIAFRGSRHDADLGATPAVHPLDEEVHHRTPVDRIDLLRAAKWLEASRVPGRGNDADGRHA